MPRKRLTVTILFAQEAEPDDDLLALNRRLAQQAVFANFEAYIQKRQIGHVPQEMGEIHAVAE